MAVIPHPNLDRASAEETLDYVVDRFHPRLYVACSFQKEASVIMDMLLRIEPSARFFTLDTDLLFDETYETKRALEARYDVEIDVYRGLPLGAQEALHGPELWKSNPDACCGIRKVTPLKRALEERYDVEIDVYRGLPLGAQEALHGPELWKSNPDACCGIRKVTPLKRALEDVDCWVAGLRRAQSDSRRFSSKLAFDERHGLWKANPLADWTEAQVWAYIDKHDVPYNPLHDRGYESIGCTHCTLPSSGRDGRWAELDKTECGLHG
jgi:phosphoadenosine phosphosulfate reductase